MPQKKSPGWHQGKKRGENKKLLSSSYPAPALPVKGKCCSGCHYFRSIPRARLNRMFCAFTGETVSETWHCPFWEPKTAGGDA